MKNELRICKNAKRGQVLKIFVNKVVANIFYNSLTVKGKRNCLSGGENIKVIFNLLLVLTLTFFPSFSYARSCNGSEYDKAEYFSEKAGKKMVEKYGGGQNIRVNMTSCSYNSYSGKFKTKIEIYWDGSVFSSNNYNIDGELTMTSEGTKAEFSETYANSNVEDIRFWGYVIGGAIVLGTLSNSE